MFGGRVPQVEGTELVKTQRQRSLYGCIRVGSMLRGRKCNCSHGQVLNQMGFCMQSNGKTEDVITKCILVVICQKFKLILSSL